MWSIREIHIMMIQKTIPPSVLYRCYEQIDVEIWARCDGNDRAGKARQSALRRNV